MDPLWSLGSFTTYLTTFILMASKASKTAKLFGSIEKGLASWKRIKPLIRPYEDYALPKEVHGIFVSSSLMARLNFVFASFLVIAIFYYLYRMGSTFIKKDKDFLKVFLPFSAVEIALGIASAILYGGKASLITSLLQWVLALPLVLSSAHYVSKKKPRSLAPFIIASILVNLLISEWLDFQELLVWDITCVPSIGLSLVAIVGIVVFLRRELELQQKFAKEAELQERYRISREEALKGQIKPHFIFNCLSAIESSYHKNIDDGDHVFVIFAENRRFGGEAIVIQESRISPEEAPLSIFPEDRGFRRGKDLIKE